MRRSKNKSLAMKKADKYFSMYIRLRDADENGICTCATSGKKQHWKDVDTGHFISRRYQSTRYDEKNCAAQSRASNRFNQGEQFKFALAIDKRWGEGTAEKLLQKSQMVCKRTQFDFEMIAEEYKNKVDELLNSKE